MSELHKNIKWKNNLFYRKCFKNHFLLDTSAIDALRRFKTEALKSHALLDGQFQRLGTLYNPISG